MTEALLSLDNQILDALERSPYISNRKLRIDIHEGRVTLRGEVSSFYQKQMAQEALKRLTGIAHIDNHLEVNWA